MKKSNADWQKTLTPEQYNVCWQKGTEAPFTGKYHDHHETGIYRCLCCKSALFSSDSKFDSGTGWPSFFQPTSPDAVGEREDISHGMRRVEVYCKTCDAHLGHLFDDGPEPTGKRFCINSAAIEWEKN